MKLKSPRTEVYNKRNVSIFNSVCGLRDLMTGALGHMGAGAAAVSPGQQVATSWTDGPWAKAEDGCNPCLLSRSQRSSGLTGVW